MTTINANERIINVGSAGFLHCFYSTIYKYVSNTEASAAIIFLKSGKLSFSDGLKTAREFNIIRDKLSMLSPDKIIWDINDTDAHPPWGKNISPVITSLGNYFITADGKDLIFEIILLLQYATDNGVDIEIHNK